MVTTINPNPALIPQLQCESDVGIDTIPLTSEVSFGSWQRDIPDAYHALVSEELVARIEAARAALGDRAVVLGHHYQREDIIRFADERGDSFMLAQYAAERPESEFIVFCGVHFMAEAADILSAPHQQVVLPNMEAGCSMADMAAPGDVRAAWRELEDLFGSGDDIIPVTYMNSAASLKAFCGEHGGVVCTSSNAVEVLEWAFTRGKRVFFFPDQHLGRNTGHAMGIPLEEIVLWNWRLPAGNLGGRLRRGPRALAHHPVAGPLLRAPALQHDADRRGARAVPRRADRRPPRVPLRGRRGRRRDRLDGVHRALRRAEAPAGSVIGVGTEINLVSRLAKEHPDKTVFCLDPVVCPCSTMYRVHPAYLAWVMESLAEGRVVNRLAVPEEEQAHARVALERMLALRRAGA